MKAAAKDTPVIALIQSVWSNSNSGKGHSWRILNTALYRALNLAIESHYLFALDDFVTMAKRFDVGYWFGTNPDGKGIGTGIYSHAVEHGNMSACLAFEHWKKFEPWLFVGQRLCVNYGNDQNGGGCLPLAENPAELVVNAKCRTDATALDVLRRCGAKWWVTGFDAEYIRFANYYSPENKGGWQTGKPQKLMKLTHEELAAMSKEIRAAMKPKKEKNEGKTDV